MSEQVTGGSSAGRRRRDAERYSYRGGKPVVEHGGSSAGRRRREDERYSYRRVDPSERAIQKQEAIDAERLRQQIEQQRRQAEQEYQQQVEGLAQRVNTRINIALNLQNQEHDSQRARVLLQRENNGQEHLNTSYRDTLSGPAVRDIIEGSGHDFNLAYDATQYSRNADRRFAAASDLGKVVRLSHEAVEKGIDKQAKVLVVENAHRDLKDMKDQYELFRLASKVSAFQEFTRDWRRVEHGAQTEADVLAIQMSEQLLGAVDISDLQYSEDNSRLILNADGRGRIADIYHAAHDQYEGNEAVLDAAWAKAKSRLSLFANERARTNPAEATLIRSSIRSVTARRNYDRDVETKLSAEQAKQRLEEANEAPVEVREEQDAELRKGLKQQAGDEESRVAELLAESVEALHGTVQIPEDKPEVFDVDGEQRPYREEDLTRALKKLLGEDSDAVRPHTEQTAAVEAPAIDEPKTLPIPERNMLHGADDQLQQSALNLDPPQPFGQRYMEISGESNDQSPEATRWQKITQRAHDVWERFRDIPYEGLGPEPTAEPAAPAVNVIEGIQSSFFDDNESNRRTQGVVERLQNEAHQILSDELGPEPTRQNLQELGEEALARQSGEQVPADGEDSAFIRQRKELQDRLKPQQASGTYDEEELDQPTYLRNLKKKGSPERVSEVQGVLNRLQQEAHAILSEPIPAAPTREVLRDMGGGAAIRTTDNLADNPEAALANQILAEGAEQADPFANVTDEDLRHALERINSAEGQEQEQVNVAAEEARGVLWDRLNGTTPVTTELIDQAEQILEQIREIERGAGIQPSETSTELESEIAAAIARLQEPQSVDERAPAVDLVDPYTRGQSAQDEQDSTAAVEPRIATDLAATTALADRGLAIEDDQSLVGQEQTRD